MAQRWGQQEILAIAALSDAFALSIVMKSAHSTGQGHIATHGQADDTGIKEMDQLLKCR